MTFDRMKKTGLSLLSGMLILPTCLSLPALADATSHAPKDFQSDTYIEADYEDFCSSQYSVRKCISVTIKNNSRATLDWKDDSRDGSLTGSGALEGFQVFEAPGCLHRLEVPSDVRKHVSKDGSFSRRMREEKLHYWKPGRHKTIKVLQGCTYAVAVKREIGQHHWHFTFIPSTAKSGCTLDYRYITSHADLKSYERWATFGGIGGVSEAALAGLTASSVAAYTLTSGAELALSEAVAESLVLGGMPAVVVLSATAAYEIGLWGTYGFDETIRVIDGKRDFLLGQNC